MEDKLKEIIESLEKQNEILRLLSQVKDELIEIKEKQIDQLKKEIAVLERTY